MPYNPMPRGRALRRSFTAAAVAALTLSMAACGSSNAGGSSGSTDAPAGASGTSAIGDAAASTEITSAIAKYEAPGAVPFTAPGPALTGTSVLQGKTVFYIPILEAVPFFQAGILGLRQSLVHLGATLTVCHGGANPSATSACLQEAVKEGAAGVVADSIAYGFAAQGFNAVLAAHIPLVFMNEPANAQNDQQASIGATGGQLLTKLAADWIIKASGGKADVLAVEITDSAASVDYMTQGALAEFTSACPGCKVTVVKTGTVQLQNLPSLISSALVKDPDVDYVLPEFDADVQETIQGLETGSHANVKVVSTTGVLSSLQLIKSGQHQVADVGASEYAEGWAATDQLLRMTLRKPVDTSYVAPIRIFDSANAGSLTLTPAAYNDGSWYGPTAFEQDFLRLWGK